MENEKITDILQALSKSLREAMTPLREMQKNADFEDKLILSEVLEKLMAAQGFMIDIQTQYESVLNSKQQLEQKVKHYEQWSENESQYESFRFPSGNTVVVSKNGDQSPYLKEWYCKPCFDKKKKVLLQADPMDHRQFICPDCETIYVLYGPDQEAYNEARSKK